MGVCWQSGNRWAPSAPHNEGAAVGAYICCKATTAGELYPFLHVVIGYGAAERRGDRVQDSEVDTGLCIQAELVEHAL